MMDNVKKLSCSMMGMQATERNPDFAQDAKKALGDTNDDLSKSPMLIVACTVSQSLERREEKRRENNTMQRQRLMQS